MQELLGRDYSVGIPNTEISGVACDTKYVTKDNIFFCIEGTNTDGHKFAEQAEKLGAAVIVAEKRVEVSVPLVLVNDTKEAFAKAFVKFYGKPKLKLYAVTGTNGKTTVSNFLAAILEKSGEKVGIIGTNGVYLSGERLDDVTTAPTTPSMAELYKILKKLENSGATVAVMEVSSHALAQKRVYGLEFEAGIFTNLTQDHLDYHKTMENYFKAKSELFTQSKIGIVNADDEYGKRLLHKNPRFISYGIKAGGIRAEKIEIGKSTRFLVGETPISINFTGEFNVYNALSAIACAKAVGICDTDIKAGLESVSGVLGRMEKAYSGEFEVLIDYAHTPDGLEKVITALKPIATRLVCVFGCGGERDTTKRGKMGKIATEYADFVIVTSDNPRGENPTAIICDVLSGIEKENYIVIPNRKRAIEYAVCSAEYGDIILLAGKGQEDYQIIGKEKIHFDEREIVKNALMMRKEEFFSAEIYD